MTRPAVLGSEPAFPGGLPLVRPAVPDLTAVTERLGQVLESGRLTQGPVSRELEELAADYLGVAHVVSVASCTAGLMLTYQALGVSGRVTLPSFTFAASAHAVVWAGGMPLFRDVDPEALCLDPEEAERGLEAADALSATHVFGTPCAVEALEAAADRAGVPLVFDAAHALGSRRGGIPVGRFGTAEVFSLAPTKVVVAGEGGLVATDDASLAEAVRLGRDYGNPGNYDSAFPGLNARMSELHAVVGVASLGVVDEAVARRNQLAGQLHDQLRGVPGLAFPRVDEGDTSTYKDLTLVVEPSAYGLDVEQLGRALGAEGVETRRYYHPPVHRQKAYAGVAADRRLTITEEVSPRVLTVPLWTEMETGDMRRLASAVAALHEHAGDVRTTLGAREP